LAAAAAKSLNMSPEVQRHVELAGEHQPSQNRSHQAARNYAQAAHPPAGSR
jgi:hypothetical protein